MGAEAQTREVVRRFSAAELLEGGTPEGIEFWVIRPKDATDMRRFLAEVNNGARVGVGVLFKLVAFFDFRVKRVKLVDRDFEGTALDLLRKIIG